jgi:glycosyltransferase involved in cell wall biosynthesis
MTANLVSVTVVIPTKNSAKTLKKCLDTLVAQTFHDFEIIVVDGNSNDGTKDIALSVGARIVDEKVDLSQERGRRALARNLGASEARGRILVFSDSDCSFEPTWLERLVSEIRSGADMVGGADLPFVEDSPVGQAVALVERAMKSKRTQGIEAAFAIRSCNLACRQELFAGLDGFKEMEELDLGIRVVRLGGNVIYNPEIFVYHHRRSSLLGVIQQAWDASLTTNLRMTKAVSSTKFWSVTKDKILGIGLCVCIFSLGLSLLYGFFPSALAFLLASLGAGNLLYYVFLRRRLGPRRWLWLAPLIVSITTTLRAFAIVLGYVARSLDPSSAQKR